MFHRKVAIMIMICLPMVCFSCAYPQHEFRAYIEDNIKWQMKEGCGYEGCYPMVDLLVGDGMAARFDFYKIQNGQLIFVKLTFQDAIEGIEFQPTRIIAKLEGREPLQVKAFRCPDVTWDYNRMKATSSIKSLCKIRKDDCYILFIDYQTIGRKSIAMDINDAFTLNGRSMNIPTIFFKRNPMYKE